jgi:hypothetical protein
LGNTITSLTGVSNVASATSLTLGSNGNTTAVTIDTSQNVGVNTTSMFGKFNVKQSNEGAGTNAASGFTIQRSSNDSYCGIQYQTTPDAWAISASYSSTGAYKPLIFETSDLERMRIDSSGNVGIGTSSPASVATGHTVLDVSAASGKSANIYIHGNGTSGTSAGLQIQSSTGDCGIYQASNIPMAFSTNNTERMRILSGGQVSVATTSSLGGNFNVDCTNGASFSAYVKSNTSGGAALAVNAVNPCSTHVQWYNSGTPTGSVTWNGASAVAYNTTSDYRLKESIAPMTGALAKVSQLKPCTYKWKLDGADGQGFIAHELAEVVPDCVTGEKDAVDADGNPKYQGIDTSYLVATLTAAIQEQQAIITQLQADVAALQAKVGA